MIKKMFEWLTFATNPKSSHQSIIEENRFSVFEWQWWSDSMVLIEIGISGIQFIQFDNVIEFWTWLSNGQQWNVRFDS